jgi:hypothetical protein
MVQSDGQKWLVPRGLGWKGLGPSERRIGPGILPNVPVRSMESSLIQGLEKVFSLCS